MAKTTTKNKANINPAQTAINCLVNKLGLALKHYDGTNCYLLITDKGKLISKEIIIDEDSYNSLASFNLEQRVKY